LEKSSLKRTSKIFGSSDTNSMNLVVGYSNLDKSVGEVKCDRSSVNWAAKSSRSLKVDNTVLTIINNSNEAKIYSQKWDILELDLDYERYHKKESSESLKLIPPPVEVTDTQLKTLVDNFRIGEKEIEILDDLEYLNDTILNFYIEYLKLRHQNNPDFIERVKVFSTYFYTTLKQKKERDNYV